MSEAPRPRLAAAQLGIAAAFLALAGALWLNVWGRVAPVPALAPVEARFLTTHSVRDPLEGLPSIVKAGFVYNCNSCHQHFQFPAIGGRRMAEHESIVMDHGLNSNCFNCHNPDNLETLLNIDRAAIPFEDSPVLCRKCHGPQYRDWAGGSHGRPNGHWRADSGPSIKLTCVACHDPHAPVFEPIEPAPPPLGRPAAQGGSAADSPDSKEERHG
ncbi:MAG: hypothetical protein BWZ10_02071 [candidate division BRC1 bacterium ADurb.BinA364]|nr:MAG: hypothetical protein BWZ10_02071 [candidate division BRC1 bacterium ADurb.BinA364]